jgi:hypothetical protein
VACTSWPAFSDRNEADPDQPLLTNKENNMRTDNRAQPIRTLSVYVPRLTRQRLRRPTALPKVIATSAMGRYLNRLRWLFGGG